MSEPIAPALYATGGLTFFGVVTGLHPMLLVAGFIGCWWYNTYGQPLPLGKRVGSAVIAALIAAWTTPPVVAWVTSLSWWPTAVPALTVGFPVSIAIGFLTHRVIGPALLRIAQKKAEDLA
ncbi:MAG: hypothetical protein JSR83_03935 [Proteobacteria bacterium]|nr:hypothetical protein [Pseudomonadota bacterium]